MISAYILLRLQYVASMVGLSKKSQYLEPSSRPAKTSSVMYIAKRIHQASSKLSKNRFLD